MGGTEIGSPFDRWFALALLAACFVYPVGVYATFKAQEVRARLRRRCGR